MIAAAYDLDIGKVVMLHPTLAPLETLDGKVVTPPLAKAKAHRGH